MARDYKPRAKTSKKKAPRRETRQPNGWLWMSGGLALGLCVAYGVHVYHTGQLPGTPLAIASPAPARPAAQPDSPPAETRTRFEFYSLLPEMEVIVPESEVAARATRRDAAKATASERYILQAGAFRKLADADRLRASLALTGLEATIQTVAVDGHAKWHRVRLGPYSDLKAVREVRSRLHRGSIDAMVLKIRI